MYAGGAFGADGRLYLVPCNAARVACFDPRSNTWELFGQTFREGDTKWSRPIVSSVDHCLYAFPWFCATKADARVLQIDPRKGTVQMVGESLHEQEGIKKYKCVTRLFSEGVEAADGCIYGIPENSHTIVKFDPHTKKLSTFGELDGQKYKYKYGVADRCGRFIFCIPGSAAQVLCIDTQTQTCELIGKDFGQSESPKWLGASRGGDDAIYCIPACESIKQVLRIDPVRKTTMLIGPPLREKEGWCGAVTGTDGCVYGVPYRSAQVLRLDLYSHTMLTVGDDVPYNLHAKLKNAVIGPDGAIWCMPCHPPSKILRVETADPARYTSVLKALKQSENHEVLHEAISVSQHIGSALVAAINWEATRAGGDKALVTDLLEALSPALPACLVSKDPRQAFMAQLLLRTISLTMPEAKVEVVGGVIPGKEGKDVYAGGAFGPDGRLYLVPANASHIARFDPTTETWEQFGEDLTEGGSKWTSAVKSRLDGCIYAFPGECTSTTRVLKIDTVKGTAEEVGGSVMEFAGSATDSPWRCPIEGADGCIYCCPRMATSVLRFDPRTHELSTFGDVDTGISQAHYIAANLGPSGRFIYCIPCCATRVLCIDTLTQTCEFIGGDLGKKKFKWGYGCLAGDGKIYGIPLLHDRILCIDPVSKTASLFGPTIRGGPVQWVGGAIGEDGRVYCAPFGCAQVLMINPFTRSMRKLRTRLPSALSRTLNGAVTGPDKRIYCLPNRMPARMVRITSPGASTPLKPLQAIINHPEAFQQCLHLEALRDIFMPMFLRHAYGYAKATTPVSDTKPPPNSPKNFLAVSRQLKDRLGFLEAIEATRNLPMEADRLGFASKFALSSGIRCAPAPNIWKPLPTSVESWSWPPEPLAPLRTACKIAQEGGPEGVKAAWTALSKTIASLLITIVDAVRADLPGSAKLLKAVFDRERMRSLDTYRKQLRRARRDPTYPEFKGVARSLSQLCVQHDRAKQRVQTLAFFPDLYAAAYGLRDRFQEFVHELSRRCAGSQSLKAPIKGCGRALEKLVLRPGWPEKLKTADAASVDARHLVDVLRGSIECPDFTEITYVLEMLKQLDVELGDPARAKAAGIDLEKFQIFIIRISDRFTSPTSGGWADCMINFRFAHGDDTQHVMELQLQHRQMLVVRKEGKAHNQYNSFRSAFELLETVGRAPSDSFEEKDEDQSPLDLIHQQMRAMQRRLTKVEDENNLLLSRVNKCEESNASLQRQVRAYQENMQTLSSKLGLKSVNDTPVSGDDILSSFN